MLQTALLESPRIEIFPDGRMDCKNAARYLGLKEKTLAMMRTRGRGPHFIKRGRIFYFKADLDAWLNAGRLISTAQAGKLKNLDSESSSG